MHKCNHGRMDFTFYLLVRANSNCSFENDQHLYMQSVLSKTFFSCNLNQIWPFKKVIVNYLVNNTILIRKAYKTEFYFFLLRFVI